MKVLYTDVHLDHRPRREFDGESMSLGAHPEKPARAEMILAALRRRGFGPVVSPRAPRGEELAAVHAPELLEFLESFCRRGFVRNGAGPGTRAVRESDGETEAAADAFALPGWAVVRRPRSLRWRFGLYCFDPQTPLQAGTWAAALGAAGCALSAADLLLGASGQAGRGPEDGTSALGAAGAEGRGESAVYALCRPPGHHAGRGFFGGYCYLNNAALAARRLAAADTVAVLDLDFHHGNGTQEIFYRDPSVLYVSLHADPDEAYPYFSGYADELGEGPGWGVNRNFPLPQRCDERLYGDTLAEALEVVGAFAPAFLVVSLGTDILANDPVGGMGLSVQSFGRLGEQVRGLDLPTLVVQEGGYAVEAIGECVVAFLEPWSGSPG